MAPTPEALAALADLDEPLPERMGDAAAVIARMNALMGLATLATTGGRYFGFVNGGVLPVAHAARLLAGAWDQNAALNVMAPAAATAESAVERWLVDLFGLPEGAAAGYVTGPSIANFCDVKLAERLSLFDLPSSLVAFRGG